MKIGMSTKVIALFLIAGLVPLGISGFVGQRTASKALKEQAFKQLISIRETKKEQVEEYFSNIEKQITTYSKDHMIINAMEELKSSAKMFRQENEIDDAQLKGYRSALKTYYTRDFTKEYERLNNGIDPDVDNYFDQLSNDAVLLQTFYIRSNDYVLGEKDKMDFASDRSTYSNHHGYYHNRIREYQQQFGYYDIFLVDPDSGQIVYSVFKEIDYGTSLIDGPCADTSLGKVFREANKSTNPDFVRLVDFASYSPSYDSAASFIASPIYDDQRKVGILIFQMPIDRINMVMTNNHKWKVCGLGESGETYIVGDDYTMRSQSRFLIEDKEGYHAQMAELGMDESLINVIQAKDSTILLQKIETKGTLAATAGETNIEIFEDYRHVPVLSAYAPLEIEGVDWAIMAEIDEEEALRAATTLGKRMMMISVVLLFVILGLSLLVLRITGKVTNVIKRMVTSLTDCSVQISDASNQISTASQSLAQGSSEQASSLEETSASMEEMSAMTKQNVLNAEETSKLVNECTVAAEDGNKAAVAVSNSMEEITVGSKKIAEITKIIDGIAAQTGALAAKAGVDTAQVIGQGNSFAVVAKEVKNLAHKSMDAAKDTKVMVGDCIANVEEVINDAGKYKVFKENVNKIAEGIEVMDEIASQTNTLAHKVAEDTMQIIEHGNSFSSVAKEITSHAQKSTVTAKDTKALIEDCIANVYELVTETDTKKDNKGDKDADNSVNVINKCKEFERNINKIAERIDVMDDMASQTNALALKVAEDADLIVEQGNSFDAVAKEVIDLSQKSTVAAMDTKTSTQYCVTKSDEAVNNAIKYENYKGNIEKIVNGIDIIDGIASQSNLLALNAAVEAAHASDNGEKFAAVAEEISGLAKKCTDAARDTTVLVGECVQKASDGTRIAGKCKDTMESIVNDVKKASDLTNEIKVASSEQSEGIVQVSDAVQQMDQITQQNAANAEETASASEELAAQAHTMKEQVDILAMQVGGKGDGELPPQKSDKKGAGKADNESEQQIEEKKTSGSKIFKLLLSPIFILQSIVKRKKDNDSDKEIKSDSTGSSETTPDVDNNVGGNGHGNKEDVLVKTASNESVIPMGEGENRIQEHDENFKDF